MVATCEFPSFAVRPYAIYCFAQCHVATWRNPECETWWQGPSGITNIPLAFSTDVSVAAGHDRTSSRSGLAPPSEWEQDVVKQIRRNGDFRQGHSKAQLQELLRAFIAINEKPSSSPNFKTAMPDRMEHIVVILTDPHASKDATYVLQALKVLKILSRKSDNRRHVDDSVVRAVVAHLREPLNQRVAAEAANVLLNICYEQSNVDLVLEHEGVASLVRLLGGPDTEAQANAAGAVQSICFQKNGRKGIREAGAVPLIISLLASESQKVCTRAVGALHNISSDPDAIRIIRRSNGIPKLVRLLRHEHQPVAASAAGALQNVAREVASRMIICDMDCVQALADLLSSCDLQAQVCAAGALLNVLGPTMTAHGDGQRHGMCKIMSLTVSLAAIFEGCFDHRPELDFV